jgi:hypothetical protein
MTDMVLFHFFLGLDINQYALGIKLSQTMYAKDLLVWFNMTNYKLVATTFLSRVKLEDGRDTPMVDCTKYKHLVGILLYLTHSHLDTLYTVGAVSKYMQEPHEIHWEVVECFLRYV